MINTSQRSNTVRFSSARAQRRQSKGDEQQISLRLKCSNTLQTTLDLKELLQLFFDEVTCQFPLSSLHYRHDSVTEPLQIGQSAVHHCEYQLISGNAHFGELTVTRNRKFSARELKTLELLISCLVQPLRNALMYREALQTALKDPLTGAGNRAALEMTLSRDIGLARRHQQALSVLFVDIDKFKGINDDYGHSTGDRVLSAITRQLQSCCRDTDAIFRYGGEEFIIALNRTDTLGATTIAERIRSSVAANPIQTDDQPINVTISIGVATLNSDDSMHSLFKRADSALYLAKAEGRNRVINAEALSADVAGN